MNKDEFKKELESFFDWASSRERSRASWYSALEEYASMNFHKAFDQEQSGIFWVKSEKYPTFQSYLDSIKK